MTKATEKTEAGTLQGSITVGNLKHALKTTAMAISKAAIIPTLQCVRMEQIATGLALEATDLDIGIRVVLPELGGPAEPIITPSEKFSRWANLLTGETVKIGASDKRATVMCGRAKAVLPLLPASNWQVNEVYTMKGGITLLQGATARAMSFTQMAIDEKETRATFTCVQIHGDGEKLRFVSTDGRRLMLYTIPCEEKIDLLVPVRMVKVLLALLTDDDGGINLVFDENQILSSIDADIKTYVGSRRIAGQFPAWEMVFPKDKRTNVTIKTADFMESLDRCALLSDEKSGYVDMVFSAGELALHSADDLHGEADETVAYEGALVGEYRTRLNGEYLKLLHKLDGDLTIALPEKTGASMLFKAQPHEGETLDYIVMPMRG